MRTAYSYIRWSSGKQKKGASLDRQTQDPLVLNFIKTHKLNVVKTMIDSGVSGFRGKNFSNDKALGKFIDQIRKGNIPKGSVLILENMDRFGRDVITNMIKRFIEIVENGVSIGVVSMDVIIDLETMNSNPMVWNFVSGEIQRARAESMRKATFSNNNLDGKVESAKAGNMVYFGGLSPSWISGVKNKAGEIIKKDTSDKIGVEWVLNDSRVATLKKVFRLYLEGKSATGICQMLNDKGESTLKANGLWSNTTIRRLVSSKSVMGHCTVNDFQKEGYYPEIISKADFYKAQARLDLNVKNRGGSDNIPNLFKGLVTCTCGGGITVWSSTIKEKIYSYAQCTTVKLHGDCKNIARWNMRRVEKDIFFVLLGKLPQELLANEKKPKTNDALILDDLNTKLAQVNHEMSDTIKLVGKFKLAQLDASLTKLQAREAELQDAIAEQQNKMTVAEASPYAMEKLNGLFESVNMNDWAKGMIELEKTLCDTAVRAQIRNLTPDIFKGLVFDFNKNSYKATFTNGKSVTEIFEHPSDDAIDREVRKSYKEFKKSQKAAANN